MSLETMQWLNTMTLIGYTEKRGNAWHYRAADQGDEANHYVGAVPYADVERRLFNWKALEGTFETTVLLPDGPLHHRDQNRKVIFRPPGALGPDDLGGVLAPFKGKPGEVDGYVPHGYQDVLLNKLSDIVDQSKSDLGIASAGILAMGGRAWVQIELPDSIQTPAGFTFRPFLLAATSLDGSLSTTYRTGITAVVCDNTLDAAMGEAGSVVKIRHTKGSDVKLLEIQNTLDIVHTAGDTFAAKVEELTNITVTDGQWARFLDSLPMTSPIDPKTKKPREGIKLTNARNRRSELERLYRHDDRVTPWAGTAFGVVQCVNTHGQHVTGANGKTGTEISLRNMGHVIDGTSSARDRDAVTLIREVVAA